MKRFLLCMTLLFALLMSLTVAVSAEEALRHYVDFAGMDATTELTADLMTQLCTTATDAQQQACQQQSQHLQYG